MDSWVLYNQKGVFGLDVMLYLLGEFVCLLQRVDILEMVIGLC